MAKKKGPKTAKPRVFRVATALVPVAAGTGYVPNDIVTVIIPGATFRPILRVDTVGGGGAMTGATLLGGGQYPTNAVGPFLTKNATGSGQGFVTGLTSVVRQQ